MKAPIPTFRLALITNIGRVMWCGRRLRKDWPVITSEMPHDWSAPGAVVTAFPPGVMSPVRVRVIKKARRAWGRG